MPLIILSRKNPMAVPSADPYWNNVAALLRCTASDRVTEMKSGTILQLGTTTDGSAPQGLYSIRSSMAYGSPIAIGVDDYTLEASAFVTTSAYSTILASVGNLRFGFYRNVASGTPLGATNGGSPTSLSGWNRGGPTIASLEGVWRHYALVRKSGICSIFVDGIKRYSFANTTSWPAANVGAQMGTSNGVNRAQEFRFTFGVARYDEDFTPPVGPYPTTL